jgi:signal transduction histidine kinase
VFKCPYSAIVSGDEAMKPRVLGLVNHPYHRRRVFRRCGSARRSPATSPSENLPKKLLQMSVASWLLYKEEERARIRRDLHDDINQRIALVALHHAAKHSKVLQFEVKLSYSENQLYLTVSDRGAGFDVKSAMNKGGLARKSHEE